MTVQPPRLCRLTHDPIDANELIAAVQTVADGAVCVFHGVVREDSRNRKVRFLDYDAYPEMAEHKMHAILDLEPSLGLARKRQAHEKGVSELNTMDRRPIEFHQRVRGGFKELAVADPTRFVVLDATAPAEILEWRIWRSVEAMIRVR